LQYSLSDQKEGSENSLDPELAEAVHGEFSSLCRILRGIDELAGMANIC
jgi:hypothetical protein